MGRVVAFGFVADSAGTYGIRIGEVDNDAEVRNLTAAYPTIQPGRGFEFDFYSSPVVRCT